MIIFSLRREERQHKRESEGRERTAARTLNSRRSWSTRCLAFKDEAGCSYAAYRADHPSKTKKEEGSVSFCCYVFRHIRACMVDVSRFWILVLGIWGFKVMHRLCRFVSCNVETSKLWVSRCGNVILGGSLWLRKIAPSLRWRVCLNFSLTHKGKEQQIKV